MTLQTPNPPLEPNYLTVAEVAKRLGRTIEFAQNEIKSGVLTTTAIGELISEADVLIWEQRHPLNQWRKRVRQSTSMAKDIEPWLYFGYYWRR